MKYNRAYDSSNAEDKVKLIELKKSLFEEHKIDERIMPDSSFDE